MTAPCEKRVGASRVPRTHHGGTERRHDEGPDGETRVELRSREGVYSGLGPSRGDRSRRERAKMRLRVRPAERTRLPMAKPVPRPESLLAALPADLSQSLFAKARPVSLAASETLFVAGGGGGGCYRVDEGLLKASGAPATRRGRAPSLPPPPPRGGAAPPPYRG